MINCIRRFRLTHLRFVLVFAVLPAVALNVYAQDKATLAWKLEKDDQLTLEFEQTQNVLTRIDARDRTLESGLTLVVGWKVLEVAANGDATIEQTIERIRIVTGTPGAEVKKTVDLDTANDTPLRGVSRDVMKQIKPMVGLKFTVVMSPNGKVVSVVPSAEVATAVAELPETSAIRSIFSTTAMSQLISSSAFTLSDKPVQTGDQWSENSELSMTANDGRSFTFDRIVKSKVGSMDATEANIDVEIELTQKPAAPAESPAALTSPLELTAFTGSGTIVFDHSTGTIVSSSVTTETRTRVIYREDQVKTTIGTTNNLTVTRK